MRIIIYISVSYLLTTVTILKAQDLSIFNMMSYESVNDTVGFVSLSDIYSPDSLENPDFSTEKYEGFQRTYFKLNSKNRKQFLSKTKISETDKVFIYSYSKNILISFPVSNLNVVAILNMYADSGPYSQSDYMIGFEINKKSLKGFEQYFTTTLVSIGKESPFILNQMKPVVWKKMETEKFPTLANDSTRYFALKRFHYHGSGYDKGDTYMYEGNNLQYFVQNVLSNKDDNQLIARHVVVINKNTKAIVRSAVYVDHESASPAPLNYVESEYIEQWTGKLFKNKPPVILGFEYVSFGCPGITFLSPTEKDIYIYCDNRH